MSRVARRERVELRTARALCSLPPRAIRRLAGPPVVVEGQALNPQLQLILRLRSLKGAVGATAGTAEASRKRLLLETRTFAGLPEVGGPVRDLAVPGPAGPLPARHYDPGVGVRPLLVFFHGGGHMIGNLDTHDQACRILCRHGGVHVLSVEYRKAPEDPFPAAAEDALAAFRWAAAHAAELGADPSSVAVGGDSAGGNLAAVVAGILSHSGERAPDLQLLVYPGLERATRRPSMDHFREGFFLTEADIDFFFSHYAGPEPPADDPRLNPLAHEDLSGLPPTILVTANFDPLRDEGEWYAELLREAGVPVTVRRFEDLSHGILNMTGVSADCYAAVVEMAGMLRAALDIAGVSASA